MKKEEKIRKVREIFSRYNVGEYLKGEDLVYVNTLLDKHPKAESKRKSSPCPIKVIRSMEGKYKCFEAPLGTFSYYKCLSKPNHPTEVKRAMRRAVQHQSLEVKRREFKGVEKIRCPRTDYLCTWEETHVDHDGTPFIDIANDFLKEKGLRYKDIDIEAVSAGIDKLVDERLEKEWVNYHKANAVLVSIFHKENYWKGSRRNRKFIKI